jgi:hypothetical protein
VSTSEEHDDREPRPDEVRIVDLHAQVCRSDEMIQDVGASEVLRSDSIRFSRPGAERPPLSLGNADGTCPMELLQTLAQTLERAFGLQVAHNHPFRGGFIIRSYASELPWVQLELSRAPFLADAEKRARVLAALEDWCARPGRYSHPSRQPSA